MFVSIFIYNEVLIVNVYMYGNKYGNNLTNRSTIFRKA